MHFKSLFVIRRRKEAEDKELLLNYLVQCNNKRAWF